MMIRVQHPDIPTMSIRVPEDKLDSWVGAGWRVTSVREPEVTPAPEVTPKPEKPTHKKKLSGQ